MAETIIKIGKLPVLHVFEVTGDELTLLEKGYSEAQSDLSFATSFLSLGVTSIFSLSTTMDFRWEFVGWLFGGLIMLGIGGGVYCFTKWWGNKKYSRNLMNTIRERITVVEQSDRHSPPPPPPPSDDDLPF